MKAHRGIKSTPMFFLKKESTDNRLNLASAATSLSEWFIQRVQVHVQKHTLWTLFFLYCIVDLPARWMVILNAFFRRKRSVNDLGWHVVPMARKILSNRSPLHESCSRKMAEGS